MFNSMRTADPIPTFSYAMHEFVKRHPDLAYVHFVELSALMSDIDERVQGADAAVLPPSNEFARATWGSRRYLSAGGYDCDSALAAAEKLGNTGIVFGRYFIANPDLPERLRTGTAWTPFNGGTFYTPGPVGYVDYPRARDVKAQ